MSDRSSKELLDWTDVYRFRGRSWAEWQKYVDLKCFAQKKEEKDFSSTSCAEFDPEDVKIYGKQPDFGEFDLITCNWCVRKCKPATLCTHLMNRHENLRNLTGGEARSEMEKPEEQSRVVESRLSIDSPKLKNDDKMDESGSELMNNGLSKRRVEEMKEVVPKKMKTPPISGVFRATKSETSLPLDSKGEAKNKSSSKPLADSVRPSVPVSISNASILSQLQNKGPSNNLPSEISPSPILINVHAKENTHLTAFRAVVRLKKANIPQVKRCTHDVCIFHPGYRRCKGLLTTSIYPPYSGREAQLKARCVIRGENGSPQQVGLTLGCDPALHLGHQEA